LGSIYSKSACVSSKRAYGVATSGNFDLILSGCARQPRSNKSTPFIANNVALGENNQISKTVC
jgi:hypothetical protein